MKEESTRIYFKENPVLLDKVLQQIQKTLMDKLVWLNYAFGKAYKIVQYGAEGEKIIYPAVYNGKGEYVSVLPNDNFGNFSWFDIYDPQKITQVTQPLPQYTFDGAIIFWYNMNSIYQDDEAIYSEEVKDEIVRVLTTPGLISSVGKLTIREIYEAFENIYKGESIQNIDRQFFMYPYAGIRIEFTLTTRELCQRYFT